MHSVGEQIKFTLSVNRYLAQKAIDTAELFKDQLAAQARIFKRVWGPGIDSKE
jgi:hypothetical protein